ncbi:MAG TPA: OB-fold domain-containing protein [Acidimicrobiales bacterium]|nr:OB-fold domain-containing protein [Acidimicrobiales bacterium]HLH47550.1 OB-fold domain-containing protein [Acidimicrobiales bacterium]
MELTAETCPPLPAPDDLTRFFWEGVADHKLLLLRCRACGTFIHLPRPVCRACRSTDLAPAEVSGRAVLDTWTLPAQPPDPYYRAHLPYVLAVVELPEQPKLKLVTNVVDCAEADLRLGMELEVAFREVAPGVTLPLFRPAASHQEERA